METEEQIENYFNEISEQLKDQNMAGALNLLSKILELDPENKKATTEKLLMNYPAAEQRGIRTLP